MKSGHGDDFDSVDVEDKFLESFISKSRKKNKIPSISDRLSRNDSRLTDDFSIAEPRSRKRGKVGARDSKLISFRPSNRPGAAPLVGDDLFDDYRYDIV